MVDQRRPRLCPAEAPHCGWQPIFWGPEALPIYQKHWRDHTLFYAPGYLVPIAAAQGARLLAELSAAAGQRQAAEASAPVALLIQHARQAQQARRAWLDTPYAPVCLTLYLNNHCQLRCTYCFAAAAAHPGPTLSLETARAAAEIVAENCRRQSRPFVLVLHGGGEPTLNQPLADAILSMVEELVRHRGLQLFRYIATNGVMADHQARWLARRFDRLGLSCDGPPDIQARQRPLRSGQSSTPFVENTAKIAHAAGTPFDVRVTLTPATFQRQHEIAAYICQTLRPQEIHVEPVYQSGHAGVEDGFAPAQAEQYVAEFLRARDEAQCFGVRWVASSTRPDELHGPYCHVFRDVLNLLPGDIATACFRTAEAQLALERGLAIGQQHTAGQFTLAPTHIAALRLKLQAPQPECATCFNQFHCARGCPDICLLERPPQPSFRCRAQAGLADALLCERAAALAAAP